MGRSGEGGPRRSAGLLDFNALKVRVLHAVDCGLWSDGLGGFQEIKGGSALSNRSQPGQDWSNEENGSCSPGEQGACWAGGTKVQGSRALVAT